MSRCSSDVPPGAGYGNADEGEAEGLILEALHNTGHGRTSFQELHFVQGTSIPLYLKVEGTTPPPPVLPDTALNQIQRDPDQPTRRYVWIRRQIWNSEMEISYFLRIFRTGNDINLELTGVMMPPVAAAYRWVDSYGPVSLHNVLVDIALSCLTGPLKTGFAPFVIAGLINQATSNLFFDPVARLRKQVLENPNHDFGAPDSARYLASVGGGVTYFQDRDHRTIEANFTGRILRTFIDYLDEKGIDTTELREQRNLLLNQGIIVQGGTLKANNVVAGQGSSLQATMNNIKSKIAG